MSDVAHEPSNPIEEICALVLDYAREADGRIRAEEAVSIAAAITGEACLLAAGEFSIDDHDHVPGQPVYSDRVNEILCGNASSFADVPSESALGVFRDIVAQTGYSVDSFPSLEEVLRHLTSSVGPATQWGYVPLSVGEGHKPKTMPLRAAFELRLQVREINASFEVPDRIAYIGCTAALGKILSLVTGVIDHKTILSLAVETLVGTAKLFPMTARHFAEAAR